MLSRPLAVLALLGVGSLALAAQSEQAVTLTIDGGGGGPTIDRHIFGQFAEHLGRGIYDGIWVGRDSAIPNTRGIRNDVVTALKALHVPVVRWPGGCFAEEYHWRKGIGSQGDRPVTLNPNWGSVPESNEFGTHEFMDFAGQIGADAYVSVNVGSGTPQEASEWLEYLTASVGSLADERAHNGHAGPFAVPYVGIGNESWGCGGSMSPEDYVGLMKRYARFTRNFNPAQPMQRIAVGPDGADRRYAEAVMNAWQHKDWSWNLEGLSLHSYTVGKWPPAFKATGFDESDYAALLHETLRMEDLVREQSELMDRYDPDKKVSLVVDEWGSWLAPTPGSHPDFLEQQNSQRDALIAALNLDIFARHADRVRMANIAQMVNVLQAMIFTDHERLLLTPTYHVFRMYVPFQDATLLGVHFDAGQYTLGDRQLPRLDAMAARGRDGKVWVSLVNLDARRSTWVQLDARGMDHATGETLAAPRIDSVNTFERPGEVSPRPLTAKRGKAGLRLELPPHSVSVVALR